MRCRSLTLSDDSQRTIHHVRVSVAHCGMQKGLRQPPNNLESEALPQPHGSFVVAYHEIKLHCAKPTTLRVLQGVRAHGPRHTLASSTCRGHVAAIGHVRTAAILIRAQKVSPDHVALVLRDKYFGATREPKRQ